MYANEPTTASGQPPFMPSFPETRYRSTHGGSSASTATIVPTEPESASMGAPRAPKDTGALLAMAAIRMALRSEMPREMRIGATTAQGYPNPTSPSSSAPNAHANNIV